jgi:hypothetical protein
MTSMSSSSAISTLKIRKNNCTKNILPHTSSTKVQIPMAVTRNTFTSIPDILVTFPSGNLGVLPTMYDYVYVVS